MCKGLELEGPQKETLKHCIEEAENQQPSRWAKFRNGLTMVVVGMHSATSPIPDHYDENNKLF